jgi:hypothetical protein
MTIFGIIALIALVFFGVMVLRMKSDPLENESVRSVLADPRDTIVEPSTTSSQASGSTPIEDPKPKT